MRSAVRPSSLRIRRGALALAACLIAASGVSVSVAEQAAAASPAGIKPGCTWTIHRLPVPNGWSGVRISKGDGGSTYVGSGMDRDGQNRPLIWRRGKVSQLKSPAGAPAFAHDINASGVVVGSVTLADRVVPLLLVNDRIVSLALPRGSSGAVASAINDSGLIAGQAFFPGSGNHAVTWRADQPSRVRDLGTGTGDAVLNGVTDGGSVVGWSESPDLSQHALVAGPGAALGPMPGLDPAAQSRNIAAAGSYILGSGRLMDGSNGSGGQILWFKGTPLKLPATIAGWGVGSTGVVAGMVVTQTGMTDVEIAAVWARGQSWVLPSLPLPDAYAGAVDVMDDGTVVGGSGSTSRSADAVVPVTWTCG